MNRKSIIVCIALVFWAFGAAAPAVAAKPTKEETVSFLHNALGGLAGQSGFTEASGLFRKVELVQAKLDDCSMSIEIEEYERWDGRDPEPRKLLVRNFQLKDIEKVAAVTDGYGVEGIGFYTRGQEKLITGADKTVDDYGNAKKQKEALATSAFIPARNEKMMKALNHLRKLCGAPEPLEF